MLWRGLLALQPEFIVCDEPVSALDVTSQAQIIALLERLREKLGLTMIFIAHDLRLVKNIADRVAVMYCGRIVELADKKTVFTSPAILIPACCLLHCPVF